jgi:hypothetical protein
LGQQQLLLIVLGVIIVGIAIILGIALFKTNSIESKRDVVINEGISVANNALSYYRKPTIFGGGQGSFANWEIPPQMVNSPNGSFTATVSPDKVIMIGTGNELVSGNDSVKVQFTITPSSVETIIIN